MSDLSAERLAELELWREQMHNGWRIASECGSPPSEADRVRESVHLEMKFYCAEFSAGLTVSYLASQWVETRNPYCIDAAVVRCAQAGTELPPALARLVAEVARLRMAGETRAGTPGKIKRAAAKDYAFTLMARLCAAGVTLKAASWKAAAQLQHPMFAKRYKASSLEEWYGDRQRSLEAAYRERMTPDQVDEVLRLVATLPDPPPELIGEPR